MYECHFAILPGGSNFAINLWRDVFQSDCIVGIHNRMWGMFNGEWGLWFRDLISENIQYWGDVKLVLHDLIVPHHVGPYVDNQAKLL